MAKITAATSARDLAQQIRSALLDDVHVRAALDSMEPVEDSVNSPESSFKFALRDDDNVAEFTITVKREEIYS